MPTIMLVFTPTFPGPIIIKENVGKGVRQWDKETTADKEGESKLSERSAPQAPWAVRKWVVMKRGCRGTKESQGACPG